MARNLGDELRDWRVKVQDLLRRLAADPVQGLADTEKLRATLAQILESFQQRIREALNETEDGEVSEQDAEDFYSLFGAYRGVSEALIDYHGSAAAIDWSRWQDPRS